MPRRPALRKNSRLGFSQPENVAELCGVCHCQPPKKSVLGKRGKGVRKKNRPRSQSWFWAMSHFGMKVKLCSDRWENLLGATYRMGKQRNISVSMRRLSKSGIIPASPEFPLPAARVSPALHSHKQTGSEVVPPSRCKLPLPLQ